MLIFLRLSKVFARSEMSPFNSQSLNDYIVNICFRVASELMVETLLYTPLVRCTCTFKSEGHCCITKCANWSNERRPDLIFDLERDLMVS
jgi:hypothetical protein